MTKSTKKQRVFIIFCCYPHGYIRFFLEVADIIIRKHMKLMGKLNSPQKIEKKSNRAIHRLNKRCYSTWKPHELIALHRTCAARLTFIFWKESGATWALVSLGNFLGSRPISLLTSCCIGRQEIGPSFQSSLCLERRLFLTVFIRCGGSKIK